MHILLLDNSTGPWSQLYQDGALRTWCARYFKENNLILYRGKAPRVRFLNLAINKFLGSTYIQKFWPLLQVRLNSSKIECTLVKEKMEVAIPEFWPNITLKTLAAIRYVHLNRDFEILIRANASCYVNSTALEHYLQLNPTKYLYAGPKLIGKSFVSGWAIVLNRATVEVLLSIENVSHLRYYDDEAIGLMLQVRNIRPIGVPFLEISSKDEILSKSIQELKSVPLIRVKAIQNGRRIDHELMNFIHEIVGDKQ